MLSQDLNIRGNFWLRMFYVSMIPENLFLMENEDLTLHLFAALTSLLCPFWSFFVLGLLWFNPFYIINCLVAGSSKYFMNSICYPTDRFLFFIM